MDKIVLFGPEAREKLIKGANFVADAVKLTLGPMGRNALLEKGLKITNDGVTIAKEIQLDDELEDLGLKTIREACVRTVEEVGDGTTTAITLAQAILKKAVTLLPSAKSVIKIGVMSPPQVRKKIMDETAEIVEKLKQVAVKVESKERLVEVCKTSVEDDKLAELIGGTQWDIGPDGTILAEESNSREDVVERVPGIRTDNGFAASSVINNQEKQTLELKNVPVIVTSNSVKDLKSLEYILNQLVSQKQFDIVILARAFTQDAINVIMENWKQVQPVRIYPINAPYMDYKEILKDIAASLGATFIDDEGSALESIQLSDVGHAAYIESGRWNTTFQGENNEKTSQLVKTRIDELKRQLAGSPSMFEKRNLEARISQLTNGLALIKVGGSSDAERKYKKDKIDDAVNATKSALQEGIVKGGGLALKEVSESLPDDYILKEPILAPYQQILANGCESIPENIHDPVKVTRVALERAASVASSLATAEIAVATRRKTRLEKYFTNKEVSNES